MEDRDSRRLANLPSRKRPKNPTNPTTTARRLANRELGQADRAIRAVRTIFIVGAVLYGLVTLLLTAAPPSQLRTLLLLVCVATTCLMTAGAVLVRKNPFVWSLVLACLSTLGVVGGLLMGGLPWLQAIIMFAAWGAVGQATRMKTLIARHPDLAIAQRLSGREARPSRGRRGR